MIQFCIVSIKMKKNKGSLPINSTNRACTSPTPQGFTVEALSLHYKLPWDRRDREGQDRMNQGDQGESPFTLANHKMFEKYFFSQVGLYCFFFSHVEKRVGDDPREGRGRGGRGR